jgi:hypothetical protein
MNEKCQDVLEALLCKEDLGGFQLALKIPPQPIFTKGVRELGFSFRILWNRQYFAVDDSCYKSEQLTSPKSV